MLQVPQDPDVKEGEAGVSVADLGYPQAEHHGLGRKSWGESPLTEALKGHNPEHLTPGHRPSHVTCQLAPTPAHISSAHLTSLSSFG